MYLTDLNSGKYQTPSGRRRKASEDELRRAFLARKSALAEIASI